MKKLTILITLLLLTACQGQEQDSPASDVEQKMAEMMGITVEELKNQTPEEHMKAMEKAMEGEEMMMREEPALESRADVAFVRAKHDSLSPKAQKRYYKQTQGLTVPVPDRLAELDELTIGCFGPSSVLSMNPSGESLGGQCCGTLSSYEAYELQLQALHRFIAENGNLSFILRDPYDTPITVAQDFTSYDQEVQLSSSEQKVFDDAVAMSHHGGPCCCKCWKWYVMSGVGKKTIREHQWNARQVAKLWDLSSSCGHDEDTNMPQHYSVHS